jgi:RNA polymerase sigma-70 factor (ECF subfamily)
MVSSRSRTADSDPAGVETTARLLALVRSGDDEARERLVARYLPILRRWARGRLPARARDLTETDDLVQITLLRALNRLPDFEPRREGAFLAYLRKILLNSMREEIRRSGRMPAREPLADSSPDPVHVAREADVVTLIAYERALGRLPALQHEAVVLRIEFGLSYAEISAAIGSPSSDAARMMVKRGLVRLAETMQESDEKASAP